MPFNRYPAIDENGQFPDEVRLRWAANLQTSGSPEALALANVVGVSVSGAITAANIPAQVTAAVAAAPTVVNAAAAAVDARVAGLDIVLGSDVRLPVVATVPGILIALLDQARHRTWLEANDTDGGPTARAAALISQYLVAASLPADFKTALAADVQATIGIVKANILGIIAAITDQAGHRTWLEARDSDGGPTDRSISLLLPRLGLGADSIPESYLAPSVRSRLNPAEPGGLVIRTASGSVVVDDPATGARRTIAAPGASWAGITPDGLVEWTDTNGSWALRTLTGPIIRAFSRLDQITMWGDSLTAAGGIRTRLLELLPAGTSIANEGIGGQRPDEIAARMLGTSVSVTGDQIPASGGVVVNPTVKLGYSYAGTGGQEGSFSRAVTIAGVHGTISKPAVASGGTAVYTFTRDTPGSAVAVPPGTWMYVDNGEASRERVVTIWLGRNNINQDVVSYVKQMVAYLTPHTKRFLIITPTTATNELQGSSTWNRFVQVETELVALYPNRVLNARKYLVEHGMQDAGLTPTAEDQVSLNGLTIPPSLMLPGDTIHFNTTAQTLLANQAYGVFQNNGWV